MLSASEPESQELHHSADCDFSHNFQRIIVVLYLISMPHVIAVGLI